jgi:hypothetical protein
MKPVFFSLAALSLAALLLSGSLPARAGEGHDHGDSAPTATGPALPRFTAVSEAFELVGVLQGKQLLLYLDRYADNTPVRGAKIELEIAGAKHKAQPEGDDAYEVVLPAAPAPGVLPITATVTAGAEVDLLAGELDLHADTPAAEAPHGHGWARLAGWGAAALALLAALGYAWRRMRASRPQRAGGAA